MLMFFIIYIDLEWFLVEKGIVTDSELQEDPREARESSRKGKGGGKLYGVSRRTGLDSDDEDFNDD